jgi:hypothetical protein
VDRGCQAHADSLALAARGGQGGAQPLESLSAPDGLKLRRSPFAGVSPGASMQVNPLRKFA